MTQAVDPKRGGPDPVPPAPAGAGKDSAASIVATLEAGSGPLVVYVDSPADVRPLQRAITDHIAAELASGDPRAINDVNGLIHRYLDRIQWRIGRPEDETPGTKLPYPVWEPDDGARRCVPLPLMLSSRELAPATGLEFCPYHGARLGREEHILQRVVSSIVETLCTTDMGVDLAVYPEAHRLFAYRVDRTVRRRLHERITLGKDTGKRTGLTPDRHVQHLMDRVTIHGAGDPPAPTQLEYAARWLEPLGVKLVDHLEPLPEPVCCEAAGVVAAVRRGEKPVISLSQIDLENSTTTQDVERAGGHLRSLGVRTHTITFKDCSQVMCQTVVGEEGASGWHVTAAPRPASACRSGCKGLL